MNNKTIIFDFGATLDTNGIHWFYVFKQEHLKYNSFLSDEQLRETIVSLYFPDKETNLLKPEARLVNVKELLNSPYNVLVELLISGPKNEKLKGIIPENTQLLNSTLEGDCLILDFSEELLNYNKESEKAKDNLIYSIVNTVTELNEVNKVKFLINGQSNEEFSETYMRK